MDTITIDFDDYEELLDKRYGEVYDSWGSELSDKLFPLLKAKLRECPPPPDNSSPNYIIDNFLVNGELIDRKEDFTEDGKYCTYFEEYGGDWNKLLEDALFGDDEVACMRF